MSELYLLIPVGVVAAIYGIRKIREYQWGWVRNQSSLKGKVFVITGANTGLGYETTKALVKRHATVIMACRSLERANIALAQIRLDTTNGTMIPMELDLSSFDSIRMFVTKLKKEYPKFDCLINNAGLGSKTNELTKENFEIHFGVNHLGHFLLTDLLKDTIKANNTRVVVVASKMHEKGVIDFENLGKIVETTNTRVNPHYNNSKLANVYFARELYKKGYDVHVLCPGLCATDFFRSYNPRWYHYIAFSPIVWLFLRSAKQGAQNIIHCATDNVNTESQNPEQGYFVTSLKQTKSKIAFTNEISEKLWKESERMCGIN